MASKFFNHGPIGERDYEDGGSVISTPSSIDLAIAKREAYLKATAKLRNTLRVKLVAEFFAANKRAPWPREMDTILDKVNRQVGASK